MHFFDRKKKSEHKPSGRSCFSDDTFLFGEKKYWIVQYTPWRFLVPFTVDHNVNAQICLFEVQVDTMGHAVYITIQTPALLKF